MKRREALAGIAAATLAGMESPAATAPNVYLEVKTWRLHNSREDQSTRVADFIQNGLWPSLSRIGRKLVGAFANVIGENGPYYVTLTQYPSLMSFQECLEKLRDDQTYQDAVQKLSAGPGLPFVRVESSLLRSFDVMPQPAVPEPGEGGAHRIFELRTYESQSPTALTRKVGMFNSGEAQAFKRVGMRPVFFAETIVGPRQPNLMYMLSYDDLAARDKLWREFGSDPEWTKLRSRPELSDAEIVANISNVILRPLAFSPIR